MSEERAAIRELLLAFADDEHLMGQQHTEWIGVAPFLEEDLAFSSIGQDELGHAALLYEIELELDGIEPDDQAIDALAYNRPATDYRSSALVEYVTTDWAEAVVRHWVYDTIEDLRWQLVAESSLQPLAEVAARAQREETYHLRHANALLDPLLDVEESRRQLLAALATITPLVPSVLSPPPGEATAIAAGVSSGSLADLAGPVADAIEARFGVSIDLIPGSDLPADRTGRSTPFAPLMARMRTVFDFDPAAIW